MGELDLEPLLRRLEADPEDYEANRDLGLLLAARRVTELQAEPYLLKALASRKVDDATPQVVDRLGHIFSAKGAFLEAVELYDVASCTFPGIIDFKIRLGDALFRSGKVHGASEAYRQGIDFLYERARRSAEQRGGELVHLLGPHRVICRFFGEMSAKIDLYLKARALGYVDQARPILLAPAQDVANRALLEYWSDHIDVVFEDEEIARTFETYSDSLVYLDYYTLPDGRTLQRDLVHRFVQRAWEAEGREPLLRLKDEHREKGWEILGKLGVPQGAWIVCLHVRESGFHDEDVPWSRNLYRNADITTYIPAMMAIAAQGGWVVRIGDRSMRPLPNLPNVVDVALSEFREDWLDLFCIAESRFYLGMATGPASVPVNFGTPVVGTNWFHLGPWPYAKDDLFIHKMLRRKDNGQLLSLGDSLHGAMFGAMEPMFLEALGVEPVDNTAEDILDVVVEMMQRLDGTIVYDEEDEALQAAWQAQGDPLSVGAAPRVGRDFLRRYPDLTAAPRSRG